MEPPLEVPLRPHEKELVKYGLPLVAKMAEYVLRHYVRNMLADDLEDLGTAGLITAARRFDSALKTDFKTYARERIKGAMLDGARKKARQDVRVMVMAAAVADSACLDPDWKESLQDTDDTYRERLGRIADRVAAAAFTAHVSRTPEDLLARKQARRRAMAALREAVARLAELDRRIIEHHYFEEQDMKQVALLIELPYSTTRRYLERALDRLEKELRDRGVYTPAPPSSFA